MFVSDHTGTGHSAIDSEEVPKFVIGRAVREAPDIHHTLIQAYLLIAQGLIRLPDIY